MRNSNKFNVGDVVRVTSTDDRYPHYSFECAVQAIFVQNTPNKKDNYVEVYVNYPTLALRQRAGLYLKSTAALRISGESQLWLQPSTH